MGDRSVFRGIPVTPFTCSLRTVMMIMMFDARYDSIERVLPITSVRGGGGEGGGRGGGA
jgi:hypothetical protein